MQLKDICEECGTPHLTESDSRFCLKCGADLLITDLAIDCPECGAKISYSQKNNGCPQCGWNNRSSSSRKAMVAAFSCVLAAACLIGLLVMQAPKCSSSIENSISSPEKSSSSGSEASPNASDEPQVSGKAETSNEAYSSYEAVNTEDTSVSEDASASAVVDLANKDEFREVNLFLSNFAELPDFWADADYDGDDPDPEKIIDWGFWHYAINNDVLLRGSVNVPGAGTYDWSLDTDGLENSIKKYLGLDRDLTNYRSGRFAERDGRFYCKGNADKSRNCNYVAVAQSVSDLASGEIEVEFAIVTTSEEHQVVADSSWYTMNVDDVAESMTEEYTEDDALVAKARATLGVAGKGNDRAYELKSLSMDRDSTGGVSWSRLG